MHRRGDITVGEFKTVAAMIGVGLIGEAGLVQRAVKPVAAAVAGKHPTGAIAAMSRRRQTDDQHPRFGIAESGERLGPINLTDISARWFFRASLAPAHQSRAFPASSDALIEFIDALNHRLLLTQRGRELQQICRYHRYFGRVQWENFSAIKI